MGAAMEETFENEDDDERWVAGEVTSIEQDWGVVILCCRPIGRARPRSWARYDGCAVLQSVEAMLSVIDSLG